MNATAQFHLPDAWRIPFGLGFSVFPVEARGKKPTGAWKAYQTERATLDTVREWAKRASNVGIATGAVSGLVALDLDSDDAIADAETRGLPDTISARTGKGLHVYFRHPGGTVKNRAALLPGVDIRGDGGYVVAPGSIHPSGAEYRWENPPGLFELADMPGWLYDLLNPPKQSNDNPPRSGSGKAYGDAALAAELRKLQQAGEGQRNHQLNRSAFALAQLVAGGALDAKQTRDALHETATAIGLEPGEIEKTMASAWEAGSASPRAPEPGKGKRKRDNDGGDEVSEDRIACAFTEKYGDSLRFDHHAGKWYEWTGSRWQRNETKLAFHHARELTRELSEGEARFCKASVAAGVERHACADPVHAVTANVWDRDPLLIGTPGGTVDLKSGDYFPARQEHMITRQTGVAPDHGEPARWLQFLHEATDGDPGFVRFLRQMAGYCLTGLTNEHALFFIYGPGGNGKSVFLNVLNHILGDYATTASMDTFTASRNDRHPTDLAMLAGARMVSASETEEGRAWAESRIKQLTGGDKISARFMRQDFFEFTPAFKLVIVGNHAPVLANVDEAARRRINILPFTQKPARPDRALEDKLKGEAAQILAWAIAGCRDWQANGLVRPDIVQAATADYFDDQDLFGQWIKDRCECSDGKFEMPTPLYNDWAEYARAAGDDPGSQRAMSSKLKRAGFRFRKTNGVRAYYGLALAKTGGFPCVRVA